MSYLTPCCVHCWTSVGSGPRRQFPGRQLRIKDLEQCLKLLHLQDTKVVLGCLRLVTDAPPSIPPELALSTLQLKAAGTCIVQLMSAASDTCVVAAGFRFISWLLEGSQEVIYGACAEEFIISTLKQLQQGAESDAAVKNGAAFSMQVHFSKLCKQPIFLK